MKLRFAISILAIGLSGCQTGDKLARYEPEREAYYRCGYSTGRAMIQKNPSVAPAFALNAAKVTCSTERAAVITKIMAIYPPTTQLQIIDITDRKFDEAVATGAVS